MGVDERCYPPGGVPPALPGGPVVLLEPESLPLGFPGAPITEWRDTSGFGNHVKVPIPPLPPQLQPLFINGFPALSFNRFAALRQRLFWGVESDGSAVPLELGREYSIMVVANLTAPIVYATGPQIDSVLGAGLPALQGSDTSVRSWTQSAMASGGTAFAPLETHCWHCTRKGSDLFVGVDGVHLGGVSVMPADPISLMGIGVDTQAGPVNRATVIVQVVVWPYCLDPTNLAMAFEFLRTKFAF